VKPFQGSKKLEASGLKIAKLLQRGGFQAFWVGGTVRDLLLGRKIDNIDIATSARPSDVERLLKKVGIPSKDFGRAYGTILAATKAGPVEITTFRKESNYADRRHPQEVVFVDSYLEDSMRRDLTINSLYLDPVAGKLLDPQGAGKDLKAKLIRFVGDPKRRIDEDALRMMRAARFCAQLGYKLEKNSFAAIKTRAKYIQEISGQRIKAELDKMLVLPNKHVAVRLLDELGMLRFIMPEVTALKTVWHKSRVYHLEGSVFEHAMLALEKIRIGSPELAYAALYHDAGKGTTGKMRLKEEGMAMSFHGHEAASCEMIEALAKRLRFPGKQAQLILWITRMHMARGPFSRDMSLEKKVTLASHRYFPELLELWKADALSNIRIVDGKRQPGKPIAYDQGRELLANINANMKLAEKLSGGALIIRVTKIKSGPEIGRAKSALRNEIISGAVKNISQAKYFLKKFARHA